jgi:hypothetical protein
MPLALVLLIAGVVAPPGPLALEVVREPAAVEVDFSLVVEPPAELSATLDSGAEARLSYPLRVKAKRRAWWDRKLWSGELVAIASFDPVIGRYRCQVVLDGIITSSGEVETPEEALQWLADPPPVRVELPEARRQATLKIRVRAVFSSGTTWLIFPTQDATPWAEVVLEAPAETADAT